MLNQMKADITDSFDKIAAEGNVNQINNLALAYSTLISMASQNDSIGLHCMILLVCNTRDCLILFIYIYCVNWIFECFRRSLWMMLFLVVIKPIQAEVRCMYWNIIAWVQALYRNAGNNFRYSSLCHILNVFAWKSGQIVSYILISVDLQRGFPSPFPL